MSFTPYGLQFQTSTNRADSTTSLSFAWFGSDPSNTGTWDYAPLDEFQETEPERFEQWRRRLETDSDYFNRQLQMNQAHDTWCRQWTSSVTASTNDFTLYTNGTTIINDFNLHPRWNTRSSKLSKIKNYLNKFFKLNRSAEEIQEEKAEKKSWELVKDWLTPEEFAELTGKGEMEIQSKEDLETIYIVKKDPLATVQEIKNGNKVKSMCLISKELDLPTGDSLLSKIMLLKTDEKQFKEIAVVRNLV